jgi:hypothetical protein
MALAKLTNDVINGRASARIWRGGDSYSANATTQTDFTQSDAPDEVPYFNYAGGRIIIPAGSSITSLTFYDADMLSANKGTYGASYDSTATPAAIVLTVAAGKSYPIPADLFGCAAFRMVSNANGLVLLSLKA